MDSIEHKLHIEGRSALHTTTHDGEYDAVVKAQQATIPPSSSSPLPTLGIQQATISVPQQFIMPSDTISSLSSPTMPAVTSEAAASQGQKGGLSSTSIAGLVMLPVAAVLIAVAIFTYFWLRKRRRCTPVIIHHLGPSPPAVPEKEFSSPTTSFDSVGSGGKVRSMAAMSTPVLHTGWHASKHPKTHEDTAVHHDPWDDQRSKTSADFTTTGFVTRRATGEGNDSPIDRSSPFRLKRGNTKKRSSLDPEVMSAWPAPPQPVQPAPPQPARSGRTYMERRSISAEYFAQEEFCRDVHGTQDYWEDIRLELGSGPGPTVKS